MMIEEFVGRLDEYPTRHMIITLIEANDKMDEPRALLKKSSDQIKSQPIPKAHVSREMPDTVNQIFTESFVNISALSSIKLISSASLLASI